MLQQKNSVLSYFNIGVFMKNSRGLDWLSKPCNVDASSKKGQIILICKNKLSKVRVLTIKQWGRSTK